jgi:anti-anti-sigma factor
MPSKARTSDSPSSERPANTLKFSSMTRAAGHHVASVQLVGELDRAAAPSCAQTLREATARSRRVVVDLRQLTRVDTAGVAAIVDASRAAQRDGHRLILVRGLSQVERVLALIGGLEAVEIVDLAAGESAIQAVLHAERQDRAEVRQRARARQGFVAAIGASQIARRVDALIAQSVGDVIAP